MRSILITTVLLIFNLIAASQKTVVDYSTIKCWQHIEGEKISNNGKYLLYTILSKIEKDTTFIIQSTDNTWIRRFPGVSSYKAFITDDSRFVIFQTQGDTLIIFDPVNDSSYSLSDISFFKTPESGKGNWLAYISKNNHLVLHDLASGNKYSYHDVINFDFSESGKILLIQSKARNISKDDVSLLWINLNENRSGVTIWKGGKVVNYCFDKNEVQLCFFTESNGDINSCDSLQYYKKGMIKSRKIPIINSSEPFSKIRVNKNELKFSLDGSKVFFYLEKTINKVADPEAVKVDIWNYRDKLLQSWQQYPSIFNRIKNRQLLYAVEITTDEVVQIGRDEDDYLTQITISPDGQYALTQTQLNGNELQLNRNARPDIVLVAANDGHRQTILNKFLGKMPAFSPGSKFILWFDDLDKCYYTYEIKAKIIRNASRFIVSQLTDELDDHPKPALYNNYGIAGWLKNDEGVLIYDHYDIWQVDPLSLKKPINLTNNYGRKNRTVLRVLLPNTTGGDNSILYTQENHLILAGFNETNKYNGFFELELRSNKDPTELIMSPSVYYMPRINWVDFSTFLLKSKYNDVCVIKQMNVKEYPNLYSTRDFKAFNKLSDLHPQEDYNWVSSELVKYRTFDSRKNEAILYKPENFDPKNKYPVIFYFYEKLSNGVFKFVAPELSDGRLPIVWFVSHGYIVALVDIKYEIGKIGESVYNCVASLALHLRKKPWIDGKKMAIQGLSWGGYEVNELITKTNLFVAAASSAGTSDVISHSFNSPAGPTVLKFGYYRMGASIWERPELYLRNSPIMKADHVHTPLLIMHNKEDGSVSFSQSVAYFSALRLLNKKVWMLQYDDENHGLTIEKNRLDYTIRLQQFYDHFMKGIAAPKWMTKGVPAYLKGIENGLELDHKRKP